MYIQYCVLQDFRAEKIVGLIAYDVIAFDVQKDVLLKLIPCRIARMGIWVFHVLPFGVE